MNVEDMMSSCGGFCGTCARSTSYTEGEINDGCPAQVRLFSAVHGIALFSTDFVAAVHERT